MSGQTTAWKWKPSYGRLAVSHTLPPAEKASLQWGGGQRPSSGVPGASAQLWVLHSCLCDGILGLGMALPIGLLTPGRPRQKDRGGG